MNLILFEPAEIGLPLLRNDRRARHLLEVLRRVPGDTFDAAVVNGPRGKGILAAVDAASLRLSFTWTLEPAPPEPLTLIVGLPRPQTARDILRDATTLGLAALHFVRTEKGDPNYAHSTLWQHGEWRRHALAGAEQAFDPRVPEVTHGRPLEEVLAGLAAEGTRIALDNYESPIALGKIDRIASPAALAIGAERGWSAAERAQLRQQGFAFTHLGPRVLRTETACIAALTLVRTRLGLL